MRTGWLLATSALAGVLLTGPGVPEAGPVGAGDQTPAAPRDQAPTTPTGAAPASDASLILSIRARALGVLQDAGQLGEDDRVKAPTGAGSTRMPSGTTEIARGVYLTVMPSCIPGVDEPFLPPLRRPIPRRR
jgi:hypothetical protein